MADEKRIFERFVARFPAKFKDSMEDFGNSVYLRNASANGAKFSTRERVQMHDTVTLEVQLPQERTPMAIQGEVVRIKEQKYNVWDIGLEIQDINLMNMARLYRHVVS
ncbi:hypothetical protein MNBD_GAMMA03-987 [hydrothermal vent metagenome]|uniref:PilZ domain-containing protein n=1 Tax=hydrothermal vent metagenome TaxID=652676 RepID=A0A3B0VYQ8_9ZZZZ